MRRANAVVAAGLMVVGLAAGAVRTAHRLDRLHVRIDAAWAALDGALSRRALVVSELSSCLGGSPGGATLFDAAERALQADFSAREEIENRLCRALAGPDRTGLDPARAARLADAEQRVVIARRVYNDAVRDTLALRSCRMVRWFLLAGNAPLPRYFEIADPVG